MASENETVADIVAEMRQGMNPNGTVECQYLESDICTLADRIEAAWKREAAILNAAKSGVEFLLEFCDGRACKDCPFVDDYGCCTIDHIFKGDQK